jgi:hypothetical protein
MVLKTLIGTHFRDTETLTHCCLALYMQYILVGYLDAITNTEFTVKVSTFLPVEGGEGDMYFNHI